MREKDWFFEKKLWVYLQTAKSSQFDAESNRFCRISQNVQELVFFWKKTDWVIEKVVDFFKIAKSSKVTLQGHWKSKNSRNFRKVFFSSINGWMGLFEKNPIFQKTDKGSKFAVECDWISDNSHHVTKKEISKTRLVIRKTSWFF